MFQIILWILKIIGIVLAVILGIAVLLIAIVFFLPVCYRIEARSEGTLEESDVKARFSWLFHLFTGYFAYRNGEFDWQVRIGWKKMNQPEQNQEDTSFGQMPLKEENAGKKSSEKESVALEEAEPEIKQPEKKQEQEKEDTISEKPKQKKKKRISFFQKIKYTYRKICDKIKILLEKKENVIEFLSDTVHQAAWERLKKEVQRILHFLRPKKLKGSVCFGLDDPYNTGRVLALLSMFYPFYGEHIEIHPDFERKILKGEVLVKGHLCGIYAVIPLWNLFWDKQVRTTYQHIKTFKF